MKNIQLILALVLMVILSASCKKDPVVEPNPVETKTVTNLYAPSDVRDHTTGQIVEAMPYVYFDISSGTTVDQTASWDIAFKGTSIIVNSGISGSGTTIAGVVSNTFTGLVEAPSDDVLSTDSATALAIPAGSDSGWYSYNPINHLISPIAGKIIVVKTEEGNYAKLEILSYYKDSPVTPDPLTDPQDYFTFNYAYQADGTRTF